MSDAFQPGARVKVRDDYPVGHFRTPVYLRGKTGVVTRHLGTFDNPELLAYALEGPKKQLYEVRFRQVDLWDGYAGSPNDTVDADIYEHWLETA